MGGHLLVTGFGPFPKVPANPSEAVARRLSAHPRLRRLPGGPPQLLVLRTAYEAIEASLVPALSERPGAILMFGVAVRAKRVRVEMRAVNRVSRLFPDASGQIAERQILDANGPPYRRSVAPIAALRHLVRRGVPATLSRDAGRYLCNASYYRALREDCPVLFVHIPLLERNGAAMGRLVESAVEVAQGLMREGRDAVRGRDLARNATCPLFATSAGGSGNAR